MSASSPEDLDRQFMEAMNRGDLDALAALYEPGAVLKPQPGAEARGRDAIRDALAGYVAMKPTMMLTPRVLARGDDLALISSHWTFSGIGQDGMPVSLAGNSLEVARRQADGGWRFALDDPWGVQAMEAKGGTAAVL